MWSPPKKIIYNDGYQQIFFFFWFETFFLREMSQCEKLKNQNLFANRVLPGPEWTWNIYNKCFQRRKKKTYQQPWDKLKAPTVDAMIFDIRNVLHHVHLHIVSTVANHLVQHIQVNNVNHCCMCDVQMLSNWVHRLYVLPMIPVNWIFKEEKYFLSVENIKCDLKKRRRKENMLFYTRHWWCRS